jgi:hypothetical protein
MELSDIFESDKQRYHDYSTPYLNGNLKMVMSFDGTILFKSKQIAIFIIIIKVPK